MADVAAASSLLESLRESIIPQADFLSGVEDKIRRIEDEFESIVTWFKMFEDWSQFLTGLEQWTEKFRTCRVEAEPEILEEFRTFRSEERSQLREVLGQLMKECKTLRSVARPESREVFDRWMEEFRTSLRLKDWTRLPENFEQRMEEFKAFMFEARPQLPKDFGEEFRNYICKAEDLIETYVKTVSQKAMAAVYKKPIYWIKLWGLGKELKRIRHKIRKIRGWLSSFEGHDAERTFVDSLGEENLPESGNAMRGSDKDDNIPPYLRQCIYYFLLFPAGFKVPTRRLIVLWVAEGLIRSKKYGNESVERIAERYLNELIDLGVVCATKKNFNGRVKASQLEDGTRDAWLTKAKEAKFLQNRTGDILRLVDHHGTSDASSIQIHGNPSVSHSVQNYQDVLSFLSFDAQEGSKPGENIGDFLRKCISSGCFIWLRVLDLERVFRPKLPKTLGKLIRLKYLGLRWTYLEHLPDFVNKLFNLQVLDVKHTYISVLPKSIWSMQYLRHLYLSEIYRTRFVGRPSGISLTALQTLWGAFIDEDTCVEGGLDTLPNIRKLGLSCRSKSSQNSDTPSSSSKHVPATSGENSDMSKQLKAVSNWISNLEFLESLRLKSRDEHGKASDLHLSSLKGNKNLSTVYLLGKLDPLVVREFPASLTDITLSGSELNVDPMEFLGSLPKLQILQLLARSVVLDTMHCSRTGFPVLKVLYIWKLENLEKWEAEEGSLPSLKKLEIRSCEKLKTLPDGLQHVKTLEEFQLTSMPEGFTDVIKENQSQLWAKIEHVLKIK